MKLIKLSALYIFCSFTVVFSQVKMSEAKFINENKTVTGSYVIDGQFAMQNFFQRNGINITAEAAAHPALRKTTAWNFTKGSKYTWWAADQTSGTTKPYYQVASTCQKVGVHCYVFVEDASWGVYVDSNAVNAVVNAFDKANANGKKGIYQCDVDTYGTPPDVDHDPRIIILILDIKDGYVAPNGGYVAGFFNPTNEIAGANSNLAEMYYMDCNPADLMNKRSSSGLTNALGTCAHEFQHMIHYNYKGSSDQGFFDEGCSMVAEVINGYNIDEYYSFYSQTPNRYLLYWDYNDPNDVLNDYGRASNFFLYLKEQFYDADTTFFKKYVQLVNITGINAFDTYVFPSYGSRRFADILIDWWVANYLNDRTVDPKWGFKYANVPKVTSTSISNPNVSTTSSGVYKQAATYLSYIAGKNLTANFNTSGSSSIKIKAIEIGSTKQVVDVTPSTLFSVPNFGTTYTNVTFLVCHNNNNDFTNVSNPTPFPFTYTSTGTQVQTIQEIAYDASEPTGVYQWSVGDTMAVVFNGVTGMKLDSIRVALRNTVSMEGGVWIAGTSKFLSTKLATFNIAGKITPPSPYPVPWPNWVKYDLRSSNIDASSSFVVAFPVKGKYTGSTGAYNDIMVTDMKTTTAYHSYTYLIAADASSSTPGWYYVSDSDTTIALYLIRAYVSNTITGVQQTLELLPAAYKLEQNYPNPFNPSTVISYQIPAEGDVQIKVYDMLGNEVTTLVNESKTAGSYKVNWNGADSYGRKVSSGVYFYTIKANNYFETKKMVLLK